MTTVNREDYLRGLYLLEEKGQTLRSIDLADYLHVSKASVSEMIRQLNKEGLVAFKKYSRLKFTAKGRKIAKQLTSKHRIIELFLTDILKMDSKKIHKEANRLEHAFSNKSILRLRQFLGNPKKDPHGRVIP